MSTRLITNLKRRAIAWAGQLTSLAKSYAPRHVQPAISSHVEEKDDGQFIIRITVDRAEAPDARAWEFGSGIHARRGTKGKYPIVPKTAPFLEFLGTNEFDGWLIRTKKVMHPGIEAANGGKGYIAPAMIELRKRAKAELSKEIKDAIVGDLRESFGRKSS